MEIKRPISKQPLPDHARKVFSGKIFDVYQWDQVMYDGTTRVFEKIKRLDTVVVIPVLDDGTILLIEQEQPGTKVYISACGGHIEPGEDVLDAAKRELLEEVGYHADEYVLWKAIMPSTKTDQVTFYFIAKGCKKVAEQELDGGEKITTKQVTFNEFLQLARKERFMEKEPIADLYEALLDPEQYAKTKELFSPKNNLNMLG